MEKESIKKKAPVRKERKQKFDQSTPIPEKISTLHEQMMTKHSSGADFIQSLAEFCKSHSHSSKKDFTLKDWIQFYADKKEIYVTDKDLAVRKLRAIRPELEIISCIEKDGRFALKVKSKTNGIGRLWIKKTEIPKKKKSDEQTFKWTYGVQGLEIGEI